MSIVNFKHLNASIHGFTAYRLGNCFQRSVAMVMDWPKAKLVIGKLDNENGPYLHCWVEVGGLDYDPSRFEDNGNKLQPYDREIYRGSQNARDVSVVSRKWVMDFAREGRLSAWILKRDDTHHTFKRSMGAELLTRIGYPHRVGANEAILPI